MNSRLESELHFWKEFIPGHAERYLKRNQLKDEIVELIGNKKEVCILDVGSGPFSTIGYTFSGIKVNLILCDILADEYRVLLDNSGFKSIIEVQKQNMTSLTYQNNSFDIINCRNALDHCENPFKAIQEMDRVCKVDGWIYLWHIAHVGKQSGYKGLHQWNIDIQNENDCLIWNREDKFLLSDCVSGFHTKILFDASKKRHIIISKKEKHG